MRLRTLLAALVTMLVLGGLLAPTSTAAGAAPVYLSGKVTAADTGRPLAHVAVVLTRNPRDPLSPISGFTSTMSDGTYRFEISSLPPGEYSMRFGEAFNSHYKTEYWNNKRSFEELDTFLLSPTTAMPNMHVRLERGPEFPTERLAGVDRWSTAAAVASNYPQAPPGAGVVVVANGQDFPDALSAAPVAALYGGPLLLTKRDTLPAPTRTQISRIAPEYILVAGGPGAVSESVLKQLEALSPNVIRIFGSNRYATSRELAREFVDPDTVYIATGRDFPDALSAAAPAGWAYAPVLLVDGLASTVDAATIDLLVELSPDRIYIAGGTGVVSPAIETHLRSLTGVQIERAAGSNRYKTSVALNSTQFPASDGSSVALLASGVGFADALTGAALAGAVGAPLYLVKTNCMPDAIGSALWAVEPSRVVLLGGSGALGPNVSMLQRCRGVDEVWPGM